MTAMEIVPAGAADVDLVAGLIGAAFHELDVAAWLVPDPDDRAKVLPANFRIFVEHALSYGEIHRAAGDPTAVAVWFRQDGAPVPPPDDYDARLAAACGAFTERFRVLDELFDAHHPHDRPHHHLAFLAVRPELHGRGLGSALLRYHHRRLDESGVGAYLEASSARSRALYERHGYRVMGGPFRLPDGGPPLWPMWRDPRPATNDPGVTRPDTSG